MSLLDPHPLIPLGGALVLHTHALFFVLGAECGALYLSHWARKKELAKENIPALVFMVFVIGLLAARIGYFVSYPSQFTGVWQVAEIWQGGLVSYWGLAAGVITLSFWISRQPKKQRALWWDGVVLAGLLAWSIGRLGNYYAADSVGVLSNLWAPFYGRVPIQLFESVLCLLSFFWLHRSHKPGQTAWWGFIFYFGGRAIIDTWRFETVAGGLHISQWVSLTTFFILLIAYHHAKK